jgi:cytochrome c2
MIKIPVPLKLLALTVGLTLFYTYVGQLVPQKRVDPPEVVELAQDLTPEQMADIGKGIFNGKGLCSTCHTLGKSGALRFPDLDGIATRATTRVPGMDALQYLASSMYAPDSFVVPGFNPGMPAIDKPPIGLTDGEILTVIAYLQTLGGTPTVTMDTQLGEAGDGGEAAPLTAESAAGVRAFNPDLLATIGCTSCHYVDQPGNLKGPSLYDVGRRLGPREILSRTLYHETVVDDSSAEGLTMAEMQSLVDYLSEKKGEG